MSDATKNTRERLDLLGIIAELEAELATEREHPTSILQCAACQRLAVVQNVQLAARAELAESDLAAVSVCGRHCPACVEFTTVFQMPKVEYLGCLRKQSESTKLLNQTAAPIGQPCPYRIVASGEPDCDACGAAWANEGGTK